MFLWFPDWFQLQRYIWKSACDGKKLPLNLTLFQWGRRDRPLCKLTPAGGRGLAISSPPPCMPLLGDTPKAGKRSYEDERGFMMGRRVRLNKAYSHLGCEPLLYDWDLWQGWHSWLLSVTEENWTWTLFSVNFRSWMGKWNNSRLLHQANVKDSSLFLVNKWITVYLVAKNEAK